MNITFPADLDNGNYLLKLTTDTNGQGQSLKVVKKGFITWLDANIFNKKSYQLPSIVNLIDQQKEQIIFNSYKEELFTSNVKTIFYSYLAERVFDYNKAHCNYLKKQGESINMFLRKLTELSSIYKRD